MLVKAHVFLPVVSQDFSIELLLLIQCELQAFLVTHPLLVFLLIAEAHIVALSLGIFLWVSKAIINILLRHEFFHQRLVLFGCWRRALLHLADGEGLRKSCAILRASHLGSVPKIELLELVLAHNFIADSLEAVGLVDSEV